MPRPMSPVARARAEALVARALAIIEQRACDPALSRKTIARELGISRSRLAHLVKRLTGATIPEHICRARLAIAKARLLDPMQSIKEIAFATGFGSTSAFDRRFVREHHQPPRAWRARELEPRSRDR